MKVPDNSHPLCGDPRGFIDLAHTLHHPELESRRPTAQQIDAQVQRLQLDRDVTPPSTTSGLVGAEEASTINRAIGWLIDKGHDPRPRTLTVPAGPPPPGPPSWPAQPNCWTHQRRPEQRTNSRRQYELPPKGPDPPQQLAACRSSAVRFANRGQRNAWPDRSQECNVEEPDKVARIQRQNDVVVAPANGTSATT